MILTGKNAQNVINGETQPNGIDIKVVNIYYPIAKDINEKVNSQLPRPLGRGLRTAKRD